MVDILKNNWLVLDGKGVRLEYRPEESEVEVRDESVESVENREFLPAFSLQEGVMTGKPRAALPDELWGKICDEKTRKVAKKIARIQSKYTAEEMKDPAVQKKCDKEVKKAKKEMWCVIAHAQGWRGDGSRVNGNVIPGDFAIFDKDEMKGDIEAYCRQFSHEYLDENGIVLLHKSIGNHGFHAIFRLQEGESIGEGQARIAKVLQCDTYDHLEDPARPAYGVPEEYVYHWNGDAFCFKSKEEAEKAAQRELGGENRKCLKVKEETGIALSESENVVGCPKDYHRVSWDAIIDRYINNRGGVTYKGLGQHNFYRAMALNFRTVLEYNQGWVYDVLPAFELGEFERKDICRWACSQGKAGMTQDMMNAIEEAERLESVEDREVEVRDESVESVEVREVEEKCCFANHSFDVNELGLPPLTPLHEMVLGHCPEAYKIPAVLVSTLYFHSLMGNMRFIYDDGIEQPMNMLMMGVADSSRGKSIISNLRYLAAPLEREDEEVERQKAEFMRAQARKKRNEPKDEEPTWPKHYCPANVSTADIAKRLTPLAGERMLMITTELDDLTNSEGFGSKKVIWRDAFDCAYWEQSRATPAGITGGGIVNMCLLAGGTGGALERLIEDADVENGLAGRIITFDIPKTRLGHQGVYKKYTDAEQRQLDAWLDELAAEDGLRYCPAVDEAMKEWMEKYADEAEENGGRYFQFYSRSAVIGRRAGYGWAQIASICTSKQVIKHSQRAKNGHTDLEIQAGIVAQWFAEFALRRDLLLWAPKLDRMAVKMTNYQPVKKYMPKDLLKELPTTFTHKDVVELYRAHGIKIDDDKNTKGYQYTHWVDDGKVVKNDDGSYTKIVR